jgi:hypothetical protein
LTFRTLRQNPTFASVAILALALGIGANTAIFGLADAVMLRILPVRDAERLVFVQNVGTQDLTAVRRIPVSNSFGTKPKASKRWPRSALGRGDG